MKKFLLASAAALFSLTFNAQTKISFEQSEGYTLGSVNGQNGWSSWGEVPAGEVTTLLPTDGVWSLQISGTGTYENYGGFEKEVTSYPKTELSFDVNIDETDASDFIFATYNNSDDYYYVSRFLFSFDGSISVYTGEGTSEEVGTWSASTTYKCKAVLDFAASTINYFIDDVEVASGVLSAEGTPFTSFTILDNVTDNYESTTATVDNIQIKDLATAAVSDVRLSDAVSIYPNPTTEMLNVSTKYNVQNINVFDVSGKTILSVKDGKTVNVSALEPGIYVAKIQTEQGSITKKFIKK